MKALYDPQEVPWERKASNWLKLLAVITLSSVIGLYVILFVYFQKLVKAENEYVMPMKARVLAFFIIAIASMLIKMVTVCAESIISFKYDNHVRIKVL